ncbi:hypothetical protein [Hyphomonas sp.]|uniref:hypothetical protein n=1 Tax=Hyphomonas sp. TaxID=87 RepID=UPI0030026C88
MSVDKVDWELLSKLDADWRESFAARRDYCGAGFKLSTFLSTPEGVAFVGNRQRFSQALRLAFPAIKAEREALVAENERLLDGINAICACLYRAEGLAPKDMADLRIEIKEAIHRARRAYKFGPALKEQSHDG